MKYRFCCCLIIFFLLCLQIHADGDFDSDDKDDDNDDDDSTLHKITCTDKNNNEIPSSMMAELNEFGIL